MKKIISLLLVVIIASSSCEKDDICDANTPTTPRLIFEFYDISNPSVLKSVTDLKVTGEGKDEPYIFNPTATGDARFVTSGTEIAIPLKTDDDTTTYTFTLNSRNSNPTLIDVDKVTFNYSRRDVYVSRACGFKTLFQLAPSNRIVHTAVPASKLKWMRTISVEKSNIDNENETHIKVFF
jgi:hypothetical protein